MNVTGALVMLLKSVDGGDLDVLFPPHARRRSLRFTNSRMPTAGVSGVDVCVLAGVMPGGECGAHLGQRLAPQCRRFGVWLAGAGAATPFSTPAHGAWLASGFDELLRLDAGRFTATERLLPQFDAAGRDATSSPCFIYLDLDLSAGELPALRALIDAARSARHLIIAMEKPPTGTAPRAPVARTWLDREARRPLGALHPSVDATLRSPIDVAPTVLEHFGHRATNLEGTSLLRRAGHRAGIASRTAGCVLRPQQDMDDVLEGAVHRLAIGESGAGSARLSDFEPISFVVAVNDRRELEQNLLRYRLPHHDLHEWLLIDNQQDRYRSISQLYHEAYLRAGNDLVLFAHQDVTLPPGWEARFYSALRELERRDPQWGVIGSVGVLPFLEDHSPEEPIPHYVRGHFADPSGYWLAGPLPQPVQALDEMWLGLRKRSGIGFDPSLPGFHCYGTDVCMSARAAGRQAYAIDAFVWHNCRDSAGKLISSAAGSAKMVRRWSAEFTEQHRASREYVERKWKRYLPFHTTSWRWAPGWIHPRLKSSRL
jgi:hypothetical protein